jgi:predicted DNA-binding transcriptional regulator YafY
MLGANDGEADLMMKRIRIVSATRRPVPSKWFELFGDALLKRRRVHMRYQSRGRQAMTERDVSPQRLVHYRSTWYLDAWCHKRDRLQRFALDAVEGAETLNQKAKEVAVRTVEAELDGGYGIFVGSKPHWATLEFSAGAAQWISREVWHQIQETRWLDDGRFELRVPYVNETELLMDIMRHGGHVKVVSPPSLKALIQERLQEALLANTD